MVEMAAKDAVWLDVLPSMKGFGPALAKGADSEADKAGRGAGKKFGAGMLAGVAVVAGGAALATKALYDIGSTFNDLSTDIATATGASGAELDKMVESAKRVSTEVPRSFEDIGGAVAAVESSISDFANLTDSEFDRATTNALNFSEAFEVDIDRTTQVVGQMLKGGLVADADEAFDLLTAASQKVPSALREDLLDAIDEYGPFYAQLGMSGEDAFNSLVAASDKGVFGIDKTGDALKEFTIRATDMSSASGAAYEALGMDQEAMSAKLLEGGEVGAKAFQDIVEGLQSMKDPVAQSQAALALFGTPLEDLGTNNIPTFIDSLAGANDVLGDVEGAAGRMGEALNSGPGAEFEKLKNTLIVALEPAATKLFDTIGDGLAWVNEVGLPIVQGLWESFKTGEGPLGSVRDVFDRVLDGARGLFDYFVEHALPVLAELGDFILNRLWPDIKTAFLDYIWPAIEEIGRVFKVFWEKDAKPALEGLWVFIRDTLAPFLVDFYENGIKPTFKLIGDAVKFAWDQVIKPTFHALKEGGDDLKRDFGIVKDVLTGAWDTISGGISTGWETIKGVFDKFKGGLTSLKEHFSSIKEGIANTWQGLTDGVAGPIRAVVQFVNDRFLGPVYDNLAKIPGVRSALGSRWAIPVPGMPRQNTAAQNTYGRSYGGGTGGYAQGGLIPGPFYGPHADNVLGVSDSGMPVARVNPMEYITRVSSTKRMQREFPGWLEHINAHGRPPGYAKGGQVGGSLGDALAGGGRWLMDLFTDPRKAIGGLFDRLLSGIGETLPAKVVVGAAKSGVSGLTSWIRDKVFGGESAGGGQRGPVGPPMPWQSLWGLVKGLFPDAILTSAFRNSTVAGTNVKSLHASGRAIDFALNPWSRMVGATRLLSSIKRWTELIHTPAGNAQQNRGVNTSAFAPITKRMHYNHVHLGMNQGGEVPDVFVADDGAMLAPGLNLLNNLTGGPEPLGRLDKALKIEGPLELRGRMELINGEAWFVGQLEDHPREVAMAGAGGADELGSRLGGGGGL